MFAAVLDGLDGAQLVERPEDLAGDLDHGEQAGSFTQVGQQSFLRILEFALEKGERA